MKTQTHQNDQYEYWLIGIPGNTAKESKKTENDNKDKDDKRERNDKSENVKPIIKERNEKRERSNSRDNERKDINDRRERSEKKEKSEKTVMNMEANDCRDRNDPIEDDRYCTDCWDKVQSLTKRLSENYKFPMPKLRVGTLDHLLTASVDLEKLEGLVESTVAKVVQAFADVLEEKVENLYDHLLINGSHVPEYLTKFKWDMIKFPPGLAMRSIQDNIEKQMASIDTETKQLHLDYVTARAELAILEKQEKGTLLTRNLTEFVRREDFVLESEHLMTVLVIVPKSNYNDWYNNYERLDDEVVPRSTNLLIEDTEYGLFNVTLFKRHLDQFKEKARDYRFFVKEFVYDEYKIEQERHRLLDLRQKKVMLIGPLLRTLKLNFTASFTSLTHVKTMRVFVESVLRYGLRTDFLCILVVVPKKNIKRIREVLYNEFSYLDGSLPKEESKEEKKASLAATDYFPYVSFKIKVEPTDFK